VNRALKIHRGVEIELCSIAICSYLQNNEVSYVPILSVYVSLS